MEKGFEDYSPIFVVGSGRSGTTLMYSILNGHSNIAIINELHFYDEILQMKAKLPEIKTEDDLDFLLNYLQANTDEFSHIAKLPEVIKYLKQNWNLESFSGDTYQKFLVSLFEAFAFVHGKQRFGDKTPSNLRYFDEIIEQFPNAKFIHMVRHPRDVTASRIKQSWTSNDVIINTLKWKIDILYGQQFCDNEDAYLKVRYEDFVKDPEACMRSVCAFVGEPFEQEMMGYYQKSHEFTREGSDFKNTFKPVSSQSIGKGKKSLSAAQICVLETLAGKLMADCGYSKTKLPWSAKLLAPFAVLSELLKYGAYKLVETRQRRDASDMIYGENDKLKRMLLTALLKR